MPRSTQHKRSGRGEIVPPSSKQDRIDELLKIQVQTFPSKELFTDEIQRWYRDLDVYPLGSIEWAFENWRRNGSFFPVPSDILSQCSVWAPTTGQSVCDQECQSHHGRGYGEPDVLWLWKAFSTKRAEVERSLTGSEVEALLVELDTKRKNVPAWRKTA